VVEEEGPRDPLVHGEAHAHDRDVLPGGRFAGGLGPGDEDGDAVGDGPLDDAVDVVRVEVAHGDHFRDAGELADEALVPFEVEPDAPALGPQGDGHLVEELLQEGLPGDVGEGQVPDLLQE